MTRALITGVTGQDGYYLSKLLLEKGYEVYGLVRGQNNPKIEFLRTHLPEVKVLTGDLMDTSSLIRALETSQPDELYNLGAISFVAYSWENASLTSDVTGKGVLNALEATRIYAGDDISKVKFYQASSSEMFGKVQQVPQSEETLLWPRSPYGVAKVFGHYMTINYRESYGMHASSGVLFNHESPMRGPEFVTRKISLAVARIAMGRQETIELGNLDAKRDWGFAGDYVEAMWRMLQQEEADDYVISTGETHSVHEYLDVAFNHVGISDWEKHVTQNPAFFRPAEVDLLIGDATKAREKLGWTPQVDFPSLVRMMVDADMERQRALPGLIGIMTRAFITGITGQTGSYLSEELGEAGWEVHGLVRDADALEVEYRTGHPDVVLHQGDLASARSLAGVLDEVRPDVVFNLAALSSVGASWDDPEQVAVVNALRVGTILDHALERTRNGDGVVVVQASSAEIFGRAARVPQDENTPIAPVNPYGASKAYAHHLVGVYRGEGLAATSMILYNHESPRRPEQFVTRKITRGAARVSLGLDDHISLGNLDVSRDWGWAPDYAHALRLAAEGPVGDYVVATGVVHTVRDFARIALTAAGVDDWESHIRQDPAFMRAQDASIQQGDATRAREVLGWRTTVDFEELIRRMVDNDLAQLRAAG